MRGSSPTLGARAGQDGSFKSLWRPGLGAEDIHRGQRLPVPSWHVVQGKST